jgi:large subunit ribosomal protein L13
MIIDATDLIVGRLASFAAKQALLGKTIDIVNCERAIISGNRKQIIAWLKQRANMGGPHHGVFFPKKSDRYLKRVIRNMLPWKRYKGEIALKRIKCYLGVPEELEGKKFETIKEAHKSKLPSQKSIKVLDALTHI